MASYNVPSYEIKIRTLFRQLGQTLVKYVDIISDLLQYDYQNGKCTLQESLSDIGKRLDSCVQKALDILEDLDESFSTNIPILDVKSLSKEIEKVAFDARNTRTAFQWLIEENLVTKEDILKNNIMTDNLTSLANKIHEYNDRFEEKLTTFEEGAKKLHEEVIESFIQDGIFTREAYEEAGH